MKVGDKLYCKINYIGKNGSKFLEGKIYSIIDSYENQYYISSSNILMCKIYKYDNMLKILNEYTNQQCIPVYLNTFKIATYSSDFKRIVRTMKLNKIYEIGKWK